MPPPVPKRVLTPRIRDNRASHKLYSNFHKMHRATSGDAYTQAWFDESRSISVQSVRQPDKDVDLFERINLPMQHPFQQYEFLQPDEWIPRTKETAQGYYQRCKVQCRRIVTSQRILEKQLRAYDTDSRGWQLADRCKAIVWGLAWWDATQEEATTCQQVMFASCGNQAKKRTNLHMLRSLEWNVVRETKKRSQIRASEQLIRPSLTVSLLH